MSESLKPWNELMDDADPARRARVDAEKVRVYEAQLSHQATEIVRLRELLDEAKVTFNEKQRARFERYAREKARCLAAEQQRDEAIEVLRGMVIAPSNLARAHAFLARVEF